MANTTFKGPVRSTRGFQVVSKNKLPNAANSDVETIRMSSGMPDFTGLSLTTTATGASITLLLVVRLHLSVMKMVYGILLLRWVEHQHC